MCFEVLVAAGCSLEGALPYPTLTLNSACWMLMPCIALLQLALHRVRVFTACLVGLQGSACNAALFTLDESSEGWLSQALATTPFDTT